MWNWMYGNGAHGWWMWLWPLLLVGLVFWVVWVTIRGSHGLLHESSAEDLLKRRYAAGEIDDGEFRRRRDQLRRS